ncbi:hypothetical protein FQR65_LT17075 [Abscondita terminalis]|nr:hypothetical protein FQR65_LT17075 [Abscondita terminalis]
MECLRDWLMLRRVFCIRHKEMLSCSKDSSLPVQESLRKLWMVTWSSIGLEFFVLKDYDVVIINASKQKHKIRDKIKFVNHECIPKYLQVYCLTVSMSYTQMLLSYGTKGVCALARDPADASGLAVRAPEPGIIAAADYELFFNHPNRCFDKENCFESAF